MWVERVFSEGSAGLGVMASCSWVEKVKAHRFSKASQEKRRRTVTVSGGAIHPLLPLIHQSILTRPSSLGTAAVVGCWSKAVIVLYKSWVRMVRLAWTSFCDVVSPWPPQAKIATLTDTHSLLAQWWFCDRSLRRL
jgi:hypothetical protein